MTKKLDLACGQKCAEGFEGADLAECGQKWSVDLQKFPWQWEPESFDELRCSHYVEHLPAREVEPRDLHANHYHRGHMVHFVGKDFFFAFFDECHRILKPGGKMEVIVPAGRSNAAFQDPTHRRFLMVETFAYLDRQWREANGLSHYRVDCDFVSEASGAMLPGMKDELVNGSTHWNVYAEWRITLVKR